MVCSIVAFPAHHSPATVCCGHCGTGDVRVSTSVSMTIRFAGGVNEMGPVPSGALPLGFVIRCEPCNRATYVTELDDPLYPVLMEEFGDMVKDLS